MYIKRVKINNFGKFHDKEILFDKGFNIIYGENEAGKSTIHTFIRGMLFGIDKQRGRAAANDTYSKYEPWENATYYEGVMDVVCHDKEYRLERNFNKDHKSLMITELATGRQLGENEQSVILDGIDEACYYNTVSVGQMASSPDGQMVQVLNNYAANLSNTKSTDLNMSSAIESLQKRRRDVRGQLKNESRQDLVNQDVEAENSIKVLGDLQEKLMQEEDTSIRQAKNLEQKIQEGRNRNIEKREDLARKEAQIKSVMDSQRRYEQEAALLQEQINTKKEKQKEKQLKLDQYDIEKEEDIDKLKKDASKEHAVPWYVFLILIVEIGELLYAKFKMNDNSLAAVSAAVLVITFFLIVIMIVTKKNNTEAVVQDTTDLHTTFQENAQLLEEVQELEGKQASCRKEVESCVQARDQLNAPASENSDLENKLQEAEKILAQLKEHAQECRFKFEQAKEKENQLLITQDAIRERLENYDQISSEIQAIDMAIAGINEVSRGINQNFGKQLNDLASQYLNKITKGKYSRLFMDDQYNITVQSGDMMISQDKFSTGTIEQIYLALRLAAASEMFKDPKPVMLDDTFAHYDNRRMANTMDFLSKEFSQTLLFTCHTREKVVADKLRIPYRLTLLQS